MRAVVGHRIKTAREAKNLSKAMLARMAKLPPSTVTRIEDGETWAELSTLAKLAEQLGVPVDAFFAEKVVVREPTNAEILALIGEALDISNSPLKRRLIHTLSALDDAQVRRWLSAIERETGAAVGEAFTPADPQQKPKKLSDK